MKSNRISLEAILSHLDARCVGITVSNADAPPRHEQVSGLLSQCQCALLCSTRFGPFNLPPKPSLKLLPVSVFNMPSVRAMCTNTSSSVVSKDVNVDPLSSIILYFSVHLIFHGNTRNGLNTQANKHRSIHLGPKRKAGENKVPRTRVILKGGR